MADTMRSAKGDFAELGALASGCCLERLSEWKLAAANQTGPSSAGKRSAHSELAEHESAGSGHAHMVHGSARPRERIGVGPDVLALSEPIVGEAFEIGVNQHYLAPVVRQRCCHRFLPTP